MYTVLIALPGLHFFRRCADNDTAAIVASSAEIASDGQASVVITDIQRGEVVYVREAA